ncbi:MAG: hypothetical protein ACI4K5_09300 [Ruminococcus sp.]
MNNTELDSKLKNMREELVNIIKSSSCDNEQKKIFIKLFSNLCEYSSNHIGLIENNVRNELYNYFYKSNDSFNIETVLIPKKETEKLRNSFRPVCDELEFGAFFDCSYSSFIDICSKRTHSVRVYSDNNISESCTCTIRINYNLVSQESRIFEIANQYVINKPVIFSPYARKFAEIKFKECSIPNNEITSIEIEGIDSGIIKLSKDYCLMWNVSFNDGNETTMQYDNIPAPKELITPFFNEKKFKIAYMNIYPNDYLIFNSYDRVVFLRDSKKNVLYAGSDNDDIFNCSYQKITVLNKSSEYSGSFSNYYSPCAVPCTRVKTHADIISTINAFNNNPFGVSVSEEYKIENQEYCNSEISTIKNYAPESAYYRPVNIRRITGDQRLRTIKLRSRINCILKFSGWSAVRTEDYANYVLEYLNEKYPEFCWQGVIDI